MCPKDFNNKNDKIENSPLDYVEDINFSEIWSIPLKELKINCEDRYAHN